LLCLLSSLQPYVCVKSLTYLMLLFLTSDSQCLIILYKIVD
jgi:hypothetical protein